MHSGGPQLEVRTNFSGWIERTLVERTSDPSVLAITARIRGAADQISKDEQLPRRQEKRHTIE